MPLDPKLQRLIMGRFATGVALVTTRYGESSWGMTANSVLSVSLAPPLILISVDKRNRMHGFLLEGMCFAISILSAEQEHISQRFVIPGPKDFSGIDLKVAETGAPILAAALAWVDCRVIEIVAGGDHDLFVGEPLAGEAHHGMPLLFFGGNYGRLELPSTVRVPWSGPYHLEDTCALYGSF